MSIPYRKLFNKAMEYYPQVPIKDGNTWIAILVHSITRVGEIDERNYFLWLKCHEAITIRTLKHEYFARHPLEDFELKFRGDFLEETLQIRHLRAKQRIRYKDQHHVIVLRAFEVKDILKEEEGDEIRRVEKQVRAQKDRGKNRDNAIIIDEDADSDDYMAVPSEDESDDDVVVRLGHGRKRKLPSKSSQKSQRSTSSGKEEAEIEYVKTSPERDSSAGQSNNEAGLQYEGEDSQDEQAQDEDSVVEEGQTEDEEEDGGGASIRASLVDNSPTIKSNYHNDDEESLEEQGQLENDRADLPLWEEDGDVAYEATEYGQDKGDAVEIEYSTTHFDEAMEFTRDRTWDGFYARLTALPEPSDQLDVEMQFECEFCGKHMFIKPWTHFGQGNTPICSKCTRMMLEGTKDHSMLEEMGRLINEELEEKHSRMTNSANEEASAQNLDEDAPFDYASELAAPGHINDGIIAKNGHEQEEHSNAQFQQDPEFRDSKSSGNEENAVPDSSDTSKEHDNENDSSDEQSSPDTVVSQAESDGYSTEPESLTSRTKALPTKHRSRNKKVVEETDSSEDDDSTYSSEDESMDDD